MKVEVMNFESKIALAIKKQAISMDAVLDALDEMGGKIMAYLGEQGRQVVCAPYLLYTNCSEDYSQFDIEFGFPVDAEMPVDGDLFMSKTYGGKAIAATHKGAYKDLETTYTALMDYAKENSLTLTGEYYDYYLNNPEETPENELLTQVVFPIN